jgi:hypothetical protein
MQFLDLHDDALGYVIAATPNADLIKLALTSQHIYNLARPVIKDRMFKHKYTIIETGNHPVHVLEDIFNESVIPKYVRDVRVELFDDHSQDMDESDQLEPEYCCVYKLSSVHHHMFYQTIHGMDLLTAEEKRVWSLDINASYFNICGALLLYLCEDVESLYLKSSTRLPNHAEKLLVRYQTPTDQHQPRFKSLRNLTVKLDRWQTDSSHSLQRTHRLMVLPNLEHFIFRYQRSLLENDFEWPKDLETSCTIKRLELRVWQLKSDVLCKKLEDLDQFSHSPRRGSWTHPNSAGNPDDEDDTDEEDDPNDENDQVNIFDNIPLERAYYYGRDMVALAREMLDEQTLSVSVHEHWSEPPVRLEYLIQIDERGKWTTREGVWLVGP